ncbi:MAG: AAA family ATPase [Sedimentisphaerales bacterium]|nr:AAA family ATPase [Sedimentisphaerales bacterium]
MFKNLKINNLRAITELKFDDFEQVNLIVGQNNCGKTTILEALFLLSGAPNPQLPLIINSLRGLTIFTHEIWPTYFRNMNLNDNISIESQLYLKNKIEHYQLFIKAKKRDSIELSSKNLSKELESSKNGSGIQIHGLELEYQNLNKPNEKNTTVVFETEKDIKAEGIKATDVNCYFLSSQTNFDWKARFDHAQRRKQISDIITHLKEIEPNISDLRLNAAGTLEVDVGYKQLVPFNLMGNGIIKILNVLIGMLDFNDGIVLIDEIENGLHHSVQDILWKAIFSWAKEMNVQVFATTHSYECINAFAKCSGDSLFGNKAKLYRIEREDDNFNAVEFEMDEIQRFLERNWEMR